MSVLPAGFGNSRGYQIEKSLRFRASGSTYLSRTFATPTSSTIWTFSAWVKRGAITGTFRLFGASTTTYLTFNSSDQLNLTLSGVSACTSTAVFRDPSAWYHVVYSQNGATQTLYVNSVSIATGTTAAAVFNTAISHQIGAANTSNYLDGYLAEVNFIDGHALDPSYFGQQDANGVWVPRKYTGTYGTNGFYLDFKDGSLVAALGYDAAGSNDWTVNGHSITPGVNYDWMIDTPTNNFSTLNPLAVTAATGTLNLASLRASTTITGGGNSFSTFQLPTSGKWCWEILAQSGVGAAGALVGISAIRTGDSFWYQGTPSVGYYSVNGYKYINNVGSAYGAGWTDNDIIGIGVNVDSSEITFYKNGVSQGAISFSGQELFAVVGDGNASLNVGFVINFGQYPFATSATYDAASGGYFRYTPPTGFKALNTFNLPEPVIKKPNQYMDATTYTGNGTNSPNALTVTNAGTFQPDLVWVKSRSLATSNVLEDSVRGTGYFLSSDSTAAQQATGGGDVSSFNSNGFTVSYANARTNQNAATYIGWQWKKGATSGFDIVTYTGTGSARTVSHSLGVAPSMMIVKSRSIVQDWPVYHKNSNATPQNYTLYLDLTNGATSDANMWNNTAPTSSVFTVGISGSTNQNAATYVAYLFAEIAGFSKFGSYTGNGSADGPFVYCGFRPKWVMIKRSTLDGANWVIVDSIRDSTGNNSENILFPNLTNAESDIPFIDTLSNGFKIRSTDGSINTAQTYIFAAFAEHPFGGSNVSPSPAR